MFALLLLILLLLLLLLLLYHTRVNTFHFPSDFIDTYNTNEYDVRLFNVWFLFHSHVVFVSLFL